MTYVKTNWIDNVTPVDAARMNHAEQGIADAEDLVYQGDYNPATAYNDGDIVVYNGVAYLCVKPVTGQAPVGWPATPNAAVPYGTSLPASPQDGQEAILVDSTTNPTYQWRFRYNAGSSSPYKWEFVGGSPARSAVPTSESTTTTQAWVDLTTVGPTFSVPRAGDYAVRLGSRYVHSVANTSAAIGVAIGATAADSNFAYGNSSGAGLEGSSPAYEGVLTAVAAAAVLQMRYFNRAAGTATWTDRRMFVTPIRVA